MYRTSVLLCFVLLSVCLAQSKNKCNQTQQQFLITFHPHLDAFWLNTDDQLKDLNFRPAGFLYNMNQRNSKTIFNSMLDALLQSQTRKYFITQIVFFKDWYDFLSEQKKTAVKKLLKNGQLDVANSGWVQNDQAVCYYDDILDQYTIGMNFMYEQFGYVNKIGWATDSFGHSHSQVALEHLLGFDFQGIQRIDDRYIYQRKQKPLLEFYWQPVSDSNGNKYGGVVTQVRHFLHQVNDLRNTNPPAIQRDFQQIKPNMEKLYGKNKLFRFLGNDFEEFVPKQFENLESAMKSMNQKSTCESFKYGNPKDYLEIIKKYWANNKLEIRKDDFMSNWDQDRYWSGYYTTDPDLKIICKDFSRLLNLYRKSLVKNHLQDQTIIATYGGTLKVAQQLLSVMQHHDGITATSKKHIEDLFKERMRKSSKQMISDLSEMQKINVSQECNLYQNGQSCTITMQQQKIYLTIIHQGVQKIQAISINLPSGYIYQVDGHEFNIVCFQFQCRLMFETRLESGKNNFLLHGKPFDQNSQKVVKSTIIAEKTFSQNGFNLSLDKNQILYKFAGQHYLKFGYYQSPNRGSSRSTVAWTKYGRRIDKNQHVMPGIYIMSNDGILSSSSILFQKMQVANLPKLLIARFKGSFLSVEIRIKKDQPSFLDYDFSFKPPKSDMADYFLKIQSDIKNQNSQFYHDANGYLVAKRKTGYRPDYQWQYKQEDKINANTYPACSFIYLQNQLNKLVAFIDRAQGVSTYDGSIIINIDRLAQDDYKGVGQSYPYVRENHFRFKFAVTGIKDDMQRIWQRQYDDALVGYFTAQQLQSFQVDERLFPQGSIQYLKYSASFLNSEQILLRVHNLGERENIRIQKFSQNQFIIPELALQLKFASIKESFANGLIFKQRQQWIRDPLQISSFTGSTLDSEDELVLRPLQIRSFRINIKNQIRDRQTGSPESIPGQKILQKIDMKDSTPITKHALRKRCY